MMTRRQFHASIAALGISAAARAQRPLEPELIPLSRNGWMPNNERLPVLWYHRAFNPGTADLVAAMEQTFSANQWPPQWRNGVYSYHHYHSTAHEVLGFAAGSGVLMLGGENGHTITVNAGDVLVLPTGTGHCRLHASADFLVVGAYPPNQHWDICRSAPEVAAEERMRLLPFSKTDPVTGKNGALTSAWHS